MPSFLASSYPVIGLVRSSISVSSSKEPIRVWPLIVVISCAYLNSAVINDDDGDDDSNNNNVYSVDAASSH